ncbi:hypothetical protein PCIT_a4132 [Pseudoalteromonas citrea]|uniref:Uncharacterized protein n=2 Tax=Pseudoalteromonas citrea TaxID=43655 RepID=A0AAD4FS48_9GAMM|nr:hypothetical protein [Pseudoalteromonas citrea]KAF7771531.1 hypothetical protein PCIT_a4132 [Pseudoalteromonas citrea]
MGVTKNNGSQIPKPCINGTPPILDSYIELVGGRACGLRHHWSEQNTISAQLNKQSTACLDTDDDCEDEFVQLLFTCCESSLKHYRPSIRHEFFTYVLQNKSVLRSLYTYLRCNDVSAEHYETILENAKLMLQKNIVQPSSALTLYLRSMINHAIYGLAREALSSAYEEEHL